MPPSKATLGHHFEIDQEHSPIKLGNVFKNEKRNEKTIAFSTIIIVLVAMIFGFNAVSQFER